MFFWIWMFSLPLFFFYGIRGSYFKGQKSYPISRWMIGNFGGSNMMCKSSRVAVGRMQLECPGGTEFNANYHQLGGLSNHLSSFSWCDQEALDVELKEKGHKNCSMAVSGNTR